MMNKSNVRTRVHNPNPQTGDYVRRLVGEAQRWADHALEHSRLQPATVYRKALDSLSFSLEHRAHSLAIPSKLSGVSKHQDVLRALHELELPSGTQLITELQEDEIVVLFGDRRCGTIHTKHRWLRPLIPFGATVHLLQVTGTDDPERWMGLNVAIAHVIPAIDRMQRASGDGLSGAAPEVPGDPDDIVLWRDEDGVACASVPHVELHSPTGIEWGYGGSGPADLALSVLCRFTTRREAGRLHQRFKQDVIASMPTEGGQIEAAFVRSWLRDNA